MDIGNMLNAKGPTSKGMARHSGHPQMMETTSSMPASVRNGTGYPSPAETTQSMTLLSNDYEDPSAFDGMYPQRPQLDISSQQTDMQINARISPSPASDGSRTFPCETCNKGFARRSDLARHVRIHTGDRPHVCPEPGCGKPFIQRSALTVHMRVHSGEKPHMCERCGKPFSDSSSLARHRRIHSGKRPYKCPFADCQKTFTRRTTLTRHQNHHTGTVEEAAAATARALASRGPSNGQRRDSNGTSYSESGSQLSMSIGTPTSDRDSSLSPPTDLPGLPALTPSSSSMSYHSAPDTRPPHLRTGLQQPSPRSSPSASSPSLSAFGASNSTNFQRPPITSHPTLPVLEPPAYHELRSGSGSPHLSSGSPHLSGAGGWQSPVHPNLSISSPMGGDYPMYTEPPPPPPMSMPMYLPSSGVRRPTSTEPDHYELKPRLASSNGPVWGGGM